jgi:predicted ATPase
LRDLTSIGGGFQKAVQDRKGVSKIRCLAARRYPAVSISVEIGGETNKPDWSYLLEFTQDNNRRAFITREIVKRDGKTYLERPDTDDKSDKERLTQTLLEQKIANKDFREIADFLGAVRYLHIIPQLIREPERFKEKYKTNDPYGGDFIEQIIRTTKKTKDSRMKKITSALKIAVPQLNDLEVKLDEMGVPHLKGLYEHWRPHAGWQEEDQFSDGTLRLLGLLWAVLDGTGPLLLEEPELSLHPGVVRYIPQMIARLCMKTGRQVIISTHSAELLRDKDIAPDEVYILQPKYGGSEGTTVYSIKTDSELMTLFKSGLDMADISVSRTTPKNADQLTMFGDI